MVLSACIYCGMGHTDYCAHRVALEKTDCWYVLPNQPVAYDDYVRRFTSVAIILTSGTDATTRHVAEGHLLGRLGFLIVDSGRDG